MKSACIAALFCGGILSSTSLADFTGITGSLNPTPVGNIQPSLGTNYLIRTEGIYPSANGSPVGTIGEIIRFGGNFAPDGFEFANGQLLSIAQNTALFSLLGTSWGGNGQTTFGLPNLQGRTPIGKGQGPGLSNYVLGQVTGTETNTLNVGNLPSHLHSLPFNPPANTTNTGGEVPYSNMQPTAAINYIVPLNGIYPSHDGGMYVGTEPVMGFVYTTAFNYPDWASANGQLLPIAQNTALFSLLGTTYGGNGVTTFALPDLRGRAPIGTGQGPGLSAQALGQVGGTESNTMSIAQMPGHDHTISGGVTGITGGNQPQSTMQPTLALHPIIAIQGIFPSRNGGGGGVDEPLLGQIDLFAGNFAPSGWAFANGQLMSIAQNTALFALLGTTYGGNGVNTFALPDLRGRISVDDGQGLGLSPVSLGQVFGSETVTFNMSELPAHNHEYTAVPEPGSLLSVIVCASGMFFRPRPRAKK